VKPAMQRTSARQERRADYAQTNGAAYVATLLVATGARASVLVKPSESSFSDGHRAKAQAAPDAVILQALSP
jgi:hypothetical protein